MQLSCSVQTKLLSLLSVSFVVSALPGFSLNTALTPTGTGVPGGSGTGTGPYQVGSRTQYVVYASPSADAKSINDYLQKKVAHPESMLYSKADDTIDLFAYWAIPGNTKDISTSGLTQSEVDDIKRQPGVNAVIANKPFATSSFSLDTASATKLPENSPVTATYTKNGTNVAPTGTGAPQGSGSAKLRRGDSIVNEPHEGDLDKRAPKEVTVDVQRRVGNGANVPLELRAISQPYSNDPYNLPHLSTLDYAYRPEAGQGTWVYVIDSGVNKHHQDFKQGCQIVPDDRWIMVPGCRPGQSDETGHGTAVTSKICGNIAGVAKKTTIIPVKINFANPLSWTSMWTKVLQDIQRRQTENPSSARRGKTVVNFSINYPTAETFNIEGGQLKNTLRSIMALDVVIVVSAGNDAVRNHSPALTDIPSKWASEDLPIIVVSSVDQRFRRSTWSQYSDQTSAWAIGEGNAVALPYSNTGMVRTGPNTDGTSFAAPQVAGLIAYFLSLPSGAGSFTRVQGQVAKQVYNVFRTGPAAFARIADGQRVLYNQLDGSIESQGSNPLRMRGIRSPPLAPHAS